MSPSASRHSTKSCQIDLSLLIYRGGVLIGTEGGVSEEGRRGGVHKGWEHPCACGGGWGGAVDIFLFSGAISHHDSRARKTTMKSVEKCEDNPKSPRENVKTSVDTFLQQFSCKENNDKNRQNSVKAILDTI